MGKTPSEEEIFKMINMFSKGYKNYLDFNDFVLIMAF